MHPPRRRTCRSLLLAGPLIAATIGALQARAAETITYEFDRSFRLTGAAYAGKGRIEYSYDTAGNLLKREVRVFEDTDKDGLDDGWERRFFGGLGRDGTGDLDADGALDAAEFLAGTDPTDATSSLRLTRLDPSGAPAVRVEWTAQPGLRYRLQFTESITAPVWRQVGPDVTATGSVASALDGTVGTARERYYRVALVP